MFYRCALVWDHWGENTLWQFELRRLVRTVTGFPRRTFLKLTVLEHTWFNICLGLRWRVSPRGEHSIELIHQVIIHLFLYVIHGVYSSGRRLFSVEWRAYLRVEHNVTAVLTLGGVYRCWGLVIDGLKPSILASLRTGRCCLSRPSSVTSPGRLASLVLVIRYGLHSVIFSFF